MDWGEVTRLIEGLYTASDDLLRRCFVDENSHWMVTLSGASAKSWQHPRILELAVPAEFLMR
jgi:hypothetical protein